MFGGREQTVDYFSVVNELKNKSTPARSNADYRVVLKRSIEKKPLINETQQNSLKFINDCFKSVVPVKESMPPNLKSIYENYICEFKEANSVEIQVTFMRYLSLYIGGYIPHTLFIRLVYHLLGKPPLSNHLMIGLPTFLAALQFNSFTPPKSNFSSIDESIAAEVAITVTANSTDSENSHSIYKCFKLLAEGYISPNIAEKWSQILFQIVAQNAYVKEGLLALIEKGIDDPELRCNLLIQFNFTKEAIKCAKKNGLKQFLSLLEM